jgi:hypothetical protein
MAEMYADLLLCTDEISFYKVQIQLHLLIEMYLVHLLGIFDSGFLSMR